MGYGERQFGGKLYSYYAFTRTKREARAIVKILLKQKFMKGYRIIKSLEWKKTRYKIYVR